MQSAKRKMISVSDNTDMKLIASISNNAQSNPNILYDLEENNRILP